MPNNVIAEGGMIRQGFLHNYSLLAIYGLGTRGSELRQRPIYKVRSLKRLYPHYILLFGYIGAVEDLRLRGSAIYAEVASHTTLWCTEI